MERAAIADSPRPTKRTRLETITSAVCDPSPLPLATDGDAALGGPDVRCLPLRSLSDLAHCPYTLRLVRQTLTHGREKILLFRRDGATERAVGKILFVVSDGEERTDGGAGDAKIIVLDVKEEFRGTNLGGLLFTECMRALSGYGSERVLLDAEEDMSRYNRLVRFYKQLGCQVKPNTRIQYINNNDGETYRKIPMYRGLDASDRNRSSSWLEGRPFLPFCLVDAMGRCLRLRQSPLATHQWLLVQREEGDGELCIRSTLGQYLCVSSDGDVAADRTECHDWERFILRVVALPGDVAVDGQESVEGRQYLHSRSLWVLESAAHAGKHLAVDKEGFLCSSRVPTFWQKRWQKTGVAERGQDRATQPPSAASLVCTRDTPQRRLHYRTAWSTQSVAFVRGMRERYLGFRLRKMGLLEAMDLVGTAQSRPFSDGWDGVSLKSLLFFTAEHLRKRGLPDWEQLVALVHGLGRIVRSIDVNFLQEGMDEYDWTLLSKSRPVGCMCDDDLNFPEYRELSPDRLNDGYMSDLGMYRKNCGLGDLLLLWSGPEYMYHMLSANCTTIPQEGLAMLRYFSFSGWHSGGYFSELCNVDDEMMRSSVSEFNKFRCEARDQCKSNITEKDCNHLWNSHYSGIVAKYNLDGQLSW